jgi:hypothetical protein
VVSLGSDYATSEQLRELAAAADEAAQWLDATTA